MAAVLLDMAGCSAIVPYKDCSRQSLLAGLDLSGLRDVIVWCVSIEQQEEVSQRERELVHVQVHTASDRQYMGAVTYYTGV